MAKSTNQTKDLSGNTNLYVYKTEVVREMSTFIYEVSLHKYWKNGYCFLGNKFFSSKKLLHIKKSLIYYKTSDGFIEKEIDLIGVPKDFIKNQELPIFKPIISVKSKKSKKSKK